LSAAALLGVRNAVYGMQMNAMLAPRGWRKAGGGAAHHRRIGRHGPRARQTPDEQRRGFWTAGVGVFVLWNLFTLLGAVLGDALGDPRRWGLDGAAVAAFLGLLWPRLQQREPVALAVVCGVATALAVPVLPPGLPILLAAVVGAAWGWWGRDPADAPRRTPGKGAPHDALGLHPAGLRGHLPHQAGGLRHSCPLAAKPAHDPRGRRHDGGAAGRAHGDEHRLPAGAALVLDARLASLAVAALALWLRLPFLLVVVLGAAAAGGRWWGCEVGFELRRH
jgi:hypothetical protein